MKISHLLFVGLAAASISACSNEVVPGPDNQPNDGAKTQLSISAVVRTGSEVRQGTHTNTFEQNYNWVKEYLGKDKIGHLDVFLGSKNATEGLNGVIYRNFNADGGTYAAQGGAQSGTTASTARIYPQNNKANAIEVLSDAQKQVNVMLNANLTQEGANLIQWLRGGGNTTGLNERWFNTPYDLLAMNLAVTGDYTTAPTAAVSKIAKHAAGKDEILMTSEDFVYYSVNPNITAEGTVASDAQTGATADAGAASDKNRFVREIRRAAARAYVTASKTVSAVDNYKVMNGTIELGTVTSLQYVVGQGERRFYVGQKRLNEGTGNVASTYSASKGDEVRTPAYAFDPTGKFDMTASDSGAIQHYDYATLWLGAENGSADRNTANQLSDGIKVSARTAASAAEMTDEMLNGTFFLPTTHKATNSSSSGYHKGNTAYVLVRGKFEPKSFADDGVQVYLSEKTNTSPYYRYASSKTTISATTKTAGDPDGTFYYTSQGLFYRTLESAVKSFNATDNGNSGGTEYKEDGKKYVIPTGQWIKRYPAGKMLWTLWINPSTNIATNKYWDAPTVRNNIYAIHITGIAGLGENWNPLVPKPFHPNGKGGNSWDDYTNKYNPDPNPNTDPRVGGTIGVPNVPVDPTKPVDPNNPPMPPYNPGTPSNPNPNPTPDNPTPPVDPVKPVDPVNPVDPKDPLPTNKTHMSVEAGVLPWQVHGYEIELGQ